MPAVIRRRTRDPCGLSLTRFLRDAACGRVGAPSPRRAWHRPGEADAGRRCRSRAAPVGCHRGRASRPRPTPCRRRCVGTVPTARQRGHEHHPHDVAIGRDDGGPVDALLRSHGAPRSPWRGPPGSSRCPREPEGLGTLLHFTPCLRATQARQRLAGPRARVHLDQRVAFDHREPTGRRERLQVSTHRSSGLE